MNPPYRRTVIEEWNEAPPLPASCPPSPMVDDELPPDDHDLGDPGVLPTDHDHEDR